MRRLKASAEDTMDSSSDHDSKRRRVDDDASSRGAGGNDGGLMHELGSLKSMMKEILEHNLIIQSKMDAMGEKLNHLEAKNDRLEERLREMSDRQMSSMQSKMDEIGDQLNDHGSIIQDVSDRKMPSMQSKMDAMSDQLNDQVAKNQEMSDRQMYHEVLLRNQHWKYSAGGPPQSYWDSIEDDERGNSASSFLEAIEYETRNMRHGSKGGHVMGNISLRAPDYLPYDEVFESDWQEFASALEEYHHALKCIPKGQKSSLSFTDVGFSRRVYQLLSPALKRTHFESIHFSENRFGRGGIQFALNCARGNPILKEFRMEENPISNSDLEELCTMVTSHPSIEMISLYKCIDDGMTGNEMLRAVMTAGARKLKKIDLIRNRICGMGQFLHDTLASNPTLEGLNLQMNRLSEDDATLIASALKYNTNLRRLGLGLNPIGDRGKQALVDFQFDRTSLNSAAGSNHTCRISFSSGFCGMNDETVDVELLRAKKIYSVLSSRNRLCSNVKHLDDVPVEFLPDMLNSIHVYSEYHEGDDAPSRSDHDVEALSLVYEVMRRWDKALSLYESIGSGAA